MFFVFFVPETCLCPVQISAFKLMAHASSNSEATNTPVLGCEDRSLVCDVLQFGSLTSLLIPKACEHMQNALGVNDGGIKLTRSCLHERRQGGGQVSCLDIDAVRPLRMGAAINDFQFVFPFFRLLYFISVTAVGIVLLG